MLRISIFVFFLLLLNSCINKEFYKSYDSKVDSLSSGLEEMAAKYESLDTILIKLQLDTIQMQLDSISKMPEITLYPLVVNYKYIGKDYKTFWRGHPLTTRELKYTRSQLIDLKHDIEKYQMDEEEIEMYFIQEKESVRKLKDRMDYNMVMINKNMRQFSEAQPNIVYLIDSIAQTQLSD